MKYIEKYISIFIIFLIYQKFTFYFTKINKNKNYIFTFWEPKEKIPGFLRLCVKTWEFFLPEYEIIILDFNSAREYLGEPLFSEIICENMSVMVQSDAIRVAMLYKYGGIWMDADTIIVNQEFIKEFQNYELSMVNDENKFNFIAFIYASKNSIMISEWLKQIIINIKRFKFALLNQKNTTEWQKSWEEVNQWYYLGNGIIDPLLKNITGKKFYGIDKEKIKVFPELIYFGNTSLNVYESYELFYFRPGDPKFVFNNSKGLIFLHNSWTNQNIKICQKMSFYNKIFSFQNYLN